MNRFLTAFAALLAVSCAQIEIAPADEGETVVIEASMSDNGTKVSLGQKESSLDMYARWQNGDMVKVLIEANGKFIELPGSKVYAISEDGRNCLFSYTLDAKYKTSTGYRILCFTMASGEDGLEGPVEREGALDLHYPLHRCSLENFRATAFFQGGVDTPKTEFSFSHFPVYEILHMYNLSGNPCSFSLNGFNVGDNGFWFAFGATTTFASSIHSFGDACGEDWMWNADAGVGAGSVAMWNPSPAISFPSGSNMDLTSPYGKSDPVTIQPGENAVIVSSYIPTGRRIKDAQMVAEIDGNIVYSENRKSSEVELKTGNAYHMYASWDGSSLSFEAGPVSSKIGVSSNDVDFGAVAMGDSASRRLTIRNEGTKDISFAITVSGNCFGSPVQNMVRRLAPGESQDVVITFSPTWKGTCSGLVKIVTDAAAGPREITLSGTGTAEGDGRVSTDQPEHGWN